MAKINSGVAETTTYHMRESKPLSFILRKMLYHDFFEIAVIER